jgi:hypothetical protein
MSKVFISGSISIKTIPKPVLASIDRIISSNMEVLVGDADGVDAMVQSVLYRTGYKSVTVYSIYATPRNLKGPFDHKTVVPNSSSKRERELQQEKDAAMTTDSDYSLVIWDGKSRGSYGNAIRALGQKKKVKLYLASESRFLEASEVTLGEIERLYRRTNGYSAAEVVQALKEKGEDFFQQTRSLNKQLLEHHIIRKEGNTYVPMPEYQDLFLVEQYRGRVRGIRFKDDFVAWADNWIKEIKTPQEQMLL